MTATDVPPQEAVTAAIHEARRGRALSACAKSSRGAAVFSRILGVYAVGHNAQPAPFACRGTAACRVSCGKLCIHAEEAAIVAALPFWPEPQRDRIPLEIVHVKIDERGDLVAGGPPSCITCSRTILGAGIAAVWLFEAPRCTCGRTGPVHDDGCRAFDADTWRRYSALEFHEATMRHPKADMGKTNIEWADETWPTSLTSRSRPCSG